MKVTAFTLLAVLAGANAFTAKPTVPARRANILSESEVAEPEVAAEPAAAAPAPAAAAATAVTFPTFAGNPNRDLPESMAGMPGAIAPLGFWDPLFLSKDKSIEQINLYREAELAHGRTAMLGFMGIWAGESVGKATSIDLISTATGTFWLFLLGFIGIVESSRAKLFSKPSDALFYKEEFFDWDYQQEFPGDLDFDYLCARPEDPDLYMRIRNYELGNGRLAMLGVAGTVVQEYISGVPTFGVDP